MGDFRDASSRDGDTISLNQCILSCLSLSYILGVNCVVNGFMAQNLLDR